MAEFPKASSSRPRGGEELPLMLLSLRDAICNGAVVGFRLILVLIRANLTEASEWMFEYLFCSVCYLKFSLLHSRNSQRLRSSLVKLWSASVRPTRNSESVSGAMRSLRRLKFLTKQLEMKHDLRRALVDTFAKIEACSYVHGYVGLIWFRWLAAVSGFWFLLHSECCMWCGQLTPLRFHFRTLFPKQRATQS